MTTEWGTVEAHSLLATPPRTKPRLKSGDCLSRRPEPGCVAEPGRLRSEGPSHRRQPGKDRPDNGFGRSEPERIRLRRLAPPGAAAPAGLLPEREIADRHRPVDRLAHVVDRERG